MGEWSRDVTDDILDNRWTDIIVTSTFSILQSINNIKDLMSGIEEDRVRLRVLEKVSKG